MMTLSHKSFYYCSLYETKQHSMILILDCKLCSNPAGATYLQFQLSKLSVSLTVRSISKFLDCLYLGGLKGPSSRTNQRPTAGHQFENQPEKLLSLIRYSQTIRDEKSDQQQNRIFFPHQVDSLSIEFSNPIKLLSITLRNSIT